jgi:hypothetical protein
MVMFPLFSVVFLLMMKHISLNRDYLAVYLTSSPDYDMQPKDKRLLISVGSRPDEVNDFYQVT